MWKLFHSKDSIDNIIVPVSEWKGNIFSILEVELKKYFAEKVTLHFDNLMLFNQKNGMHENLLAALASAESSMYTAIPLFPDITFYIIPEGNASFLATHNLPDTSSLLPKFKSLSLYDNNVIFSEDRILKIQHNSWSTLVFSIELCDFFKGWINFTPNLEERVYLQTKHIISTTNFKKNELSLLEKIEFEEKVDSYPQFDILYQKILKVMPKLELSLEDEWRTSISSGEELIIKPIKKPKI